MQTKELELKMAGMKLQDQALLVDRAEVQSKDMADAFAQMQAHKRESDKLLESYNDRFTECQQSIEKSNEVCCCSNRLCMPLLVLSGFDAHKGKLQSSCNSIHCSLCGAAG